MAADFSIVQLLVLDIDGTLTDARVYWAGPEVGWTMAFSVRDGESIRRAAGRGLAVVPLSRNATACARVRMEALGLPVTWLGVTDKAKAFEELAAHHGVPPEHIAYVGDGREDVPVLQRVGVPCSVADGHPSARAAARYVTRAKGGEHAIEEIVDSIFDARGWSA